MRSKHTADIAYLHTALDRFWRELDNDNVVGSAQIEFLEQFGGDPTSLAAFSRLEIGNTYEPVADLVTAARELHINVGTMPDCVGAKIPARGVWFHDTPVMLVHESSVSPRFRHAVATQIGGLMVSKAAILARKSEGQRNKLAQRFADAFLYPDAAVQELRHMRSRRCFKDQAEEFGVPPATIIRRLLTVRHDVEV